MPAHKNKGVIWTPQMPDRRKHDRRSDVAEYHTSSRIMNISDRRTGPERRKQITVTVTGRAMEVQNNQKDID